MSIISIMTGFLSYLACKAFCRPAGFRGIRRDWPECCRDSDARRAAIESMREECRRTGF
jgi:hypothetical protein